MKLVFATNNPNKLREVQNLLPESITVLTLEEIGCDEDIPETADTIEGNAAQKAEYVYEKYGYFCFSDDTGLEVDALNGAPGVYSARYAGPQKNAGDNMKKLLEELKGISNRNARFKTVIALRSAEGMQLFPGIVEGVITTEGKGTHGFGYDPVFMPDGYDRTFAELSPEVKNEISHRGRAVRSLTDYLNGK
ncbi:non-canonical purine NTP diphosphatase [Robertkochia solimangrovi]|uniref:non-canonical purine NTP diphosphatase n=1 Tax=Robertkochia solimangrovi TaxID=2213046 RepID=UPI00117F8DF8|nr:non-canonical purine NTP diphosphatase [Robertkochia solimangrovi]TRZ43639.1 non-canonical purine NTP pyrophosphatase [Robertkochia solimangrovi]